MSLIPHTLAKSDPIVRDGRTDPVTGFPFTPGQRIVICPICQTPHSVESWESIGNHCSTLGCLGGGEIAQVLGATATRRSLAPFIGLGLFAIIVLLAMLITRGFGLLSQGSSSLPPQAAILPSASALSDTPAPSAISDSIQKDQSARETAFALEKKEFEISQTQVAQRQKELYLKATQTAVAAQATAQAKVFPTTAPTAPSPSVLFLEEFEGNQLDSSVWGVDSVGGFMQVGNGIVQMASSSTRYPYLYTRGDAFPNEGNFTANIHLRYDRVDVCGVGVMMTSSLVPGGLTREETSRRQRAAEENGVAIGIWQDIKQGMLIWFRSGSERIDLPISGPDTHWHELRVLYSNKRYQIFLDERRVHTSSQIPHRPRSLWMGNPVNLGKGFDCPWDTLQVDSIRVESIP